MRGVRPFDSDNLVPCMHWGLRRIRGRTGHAHAHLHHQPFHRTHDQLHAEGHLRRRRGQWPPAVNAWDNMHAQLPSTACMS